MKTIKLILLLLALAATAGAQPAPPNPAGTDGVKKPNAVPPVEPNAPTPNPAAAPSAPSAPYAQEKPAAAPPVQPRTPPAFPNFPAPPPITPRAPAVQPPTAQPAAVQPAAAASKVSTNGTTAPTIVGAGAKGDEVVLEPGDIRFHDADIVQVLEVYQELTGRTVMRPSSLPPTKITILSATTLTRKEAIQALDSILSMNGITMIPQGEKFVKAVQQASAPQEGARFNTGKAAELPEAGEYVVQVVHLTNALPKDVAQALQPFAKSANSILGIDSAGVLILRDYAENVKRMMEVVEQIDVVAKDDIEPVVIPIKYALAGDIAQVLSSLTAGGGGVTQVGTARPPTGLSSGGGTGFGGRGGTGGTGGFGNQGLQTGQAGYNQGQTGLGGTTGLGGGAAGGTRGSFQDRLRSIVRNASGSGDITVLGQTKIIADERTNSLLIFASRQDLISITNIIAKLDVVLAQVLIESLILQVTLDRTTDYGVSYLQTDPTHKGNFTGIGAINNGAFLKPNNFQALTNAAGGLASGFSYFAHAGDLDITATAVATDSRVNILSRPKIQTSHAVEANLFIGETRPYVTGTYFGYGAGSASSQYSQLQIGITLSILPLINPDGLVVMDIRQKITQVGGETKIDNNNVPITIDREANAKVAVRDRETVILGGFITTEKRKSASGVPLLKDIPFFGNFFRSTTLSDERIELMLLIRPTVLPTPEKAALVAIQEKSQLPGIIAAEREAEKDEQKRLRRVNKSLYRSEGFSN